MAKPGPKVGVPQIDWLRPYKPTAKQIALVKEYMANGCRKQNAYVTVYKPKTVGRRLELETEKMFGCAAVVSLLTQVDEEEREALRRAMQRYGATKENIINEMACIAFAGPAELSIWPGGKLADKTQALFNLAKMQGYVIDRRDIRFVGRIEDLSDAELLALEEQAKADLGPELEARGTRH